MKWDFLWYFFFSNKNLAIIKGNKLSLTAFLNFIISIVLL